MPRQAKVCLCVFFEMVSRQVKVCLGVFFETFWILRDGLDNTLIIILYLS